MSREIDLNKVLITGAGGMVGSYIDFGIKTDRTDSDITDFNAVMRMVELHRPQAIIHLAAITDMKYCEENKTLAYEVNAVGTYNLALLAREVEAKFVYVSTNAVFDGKKDGQYLPSDVARPISVYGHSKHLGELAVLGMDTRNLVVRSSWIFGGGSEKDKKFVGKIVSKLQSNEPLSAVDDVRGTPTYGKDFVKALREAITKDISGTIHITNSGNASRYEMALVMKEVLRSKSDISPALLASFPSTGNTLQNERLEAGMYSLRPWQEALKEYIETEWKNSTQN